MVRLPGGMPSTVRRSSALPCPELSSLIVPSSHPSSVLQKREIQNFDRQHAETEKKIEEAVAKMLAPKKKNLSRTASTQTLSDAAAHLRTQSPSPVPVPGKAAEEEEEELAYGVAPRVVG